MLPPACTTPHVLADADGHPSAALHISQPGLEAADPSASPGGTAFHPSQSGLEVADPIASAGGTNPHYISTYPLINKTIMDIGPFRLRIAEIIVDVGAQRGATWGFQRPPQGGTSNEKYVRITIWDYS